jgi:hypothetical protein
MKIIDPVDGQIDLCSVRDYTLRVQELLNAGFNPLETAKVPVAIAEGVIRAAIRSARGTSARKAGARETVVAVACRLEALVHYQVFSTSDAQVLQSWGDDHVRRYFRIEHEVVFQDLVCRPVPWTLEKFTWFYNTRRHAELERMAAMGGGQEALRRLATTSMAAGLFEGQATQLRAIFERTGGDARLGDALVACMFNPPRRRADVVNSRTCRSRFQRLIEDSNRHEAWSSKQAA